MRNDIADARARLLGCRDMAIGWRSLIGLAESLRESFEMKSPRIKNPGQ